MRKTVLVCAALVLAPVTPVLAAPVVTTAPAGPAAAPAPAAAAAMPKYSTTDTAIGSLLDDPAARAILDKVLPGLTSNERIEMARGMTLKSIQAFAPDKLTDERLAQVDAELAKLPK